MIVETMVHPVKDNAETANTEARRRVEKRKVATV
jgi:hypothetical protein